MKKGLEMIREGCARSDGMARTPAIALTALPAPRIGPAPCWLVYQVHLAKPVEPQELLAALANLAGRT